MAGTTTLMPGSGWNPHGPHAAKSEASRTARRMGAGVYGRDMTAPKAAYEQVKQKALGFPGAERAVLLGDHEVVRIKDKVFLWLGEEDGGCYFGVRLPQSQDAAMALPFVEPMGYGMAKWGWVGARFKKGQDVPVPMVFEWLEESYRKVAPKKLAAQLGGGGAAPVAVPAKKKVKAKTAAKRARR
jgi:predicted DNA-binding protein (MmcQ/YjbR family)